MTEHDRTRRSPPSSGNFWGSRAGLVLIAFAAIAGLLLAYEHRAHIFAGNRFLLLLLVLCIGMHFFMHGGHGGHGGGGQGRNDGGRP